MVTSVNIIDTQYTTLLFSKDKFQEYFFVYYYFSLFQQCSLTPQPQQTLDYSSNIVARKIVEVVQLRIEMQPWLHTCVHHLPSQLLHVRNKAWKRASQCPQYPGNFINNYRALENYWNLIFPKDSLNKTKNLLKLILILISVDFCIGFVLSSASL